MKLLIIFYFIFSTQLWADPIVPVYRYDHKNGPPSGMFGGYPGAVGLGGGFGIYGGSSYSDQMMNTGVTGGIGISNMGGAVSSYNVVRPNASCPFLTTTAKEDQDIFGELQNYLRSLSQNAECSQASSQQNMPNMMYGPNNQSLQAVSQLESMLNGNTNANGVKCYTQNINLITSRNMALYYADKEIDVNSMSLYSACNASSLAFKLGKMQVTKDEIKKCIADLYQNAVEENVSICKEVVAPQLIQDQTNKGMIELERLLVQTLSHPNACGAKVQSTFKMVMNTFLKASSLSAVGPWGAMAGFGADVIGSLLDQFFPSDAEKASELLSDCRETLANKIS